MMMIYMNILAYNFIMIGVIIQQTVSLKDSLHCVKWIVLVLTKIIAYLKKKYFKDIYDLHPIPLRRKIIFSFI